MGELINSQHLFDIKRLQADVDRAERTQTTPPFHQAFQQMLWGNSILHSKEYQEAQRKLTASMERHLDRIIFPYKPKED